MKISKSFVAFYVQYKLDKLKEKTFNFASETVKNELLDFGKDNFRIIKNINGAFKYQKTYEKCVINGYNDLKLMF